MSDAVRAARAAYDKARAAADSATEERSKALTAYHKERSRTM